MFSLISMLVSFIAMMSKWFSIQNLTGLIKAATTNVPQDPCDEIQMSTYFHGLADPLAKVVSQVFQQIHTHPTAMALTEADVKVMLANELRSSRVEGWEQWIEILLPLIMKLLDWWKNRQTNGDEKKKDDGKFDR